MAGLGSVTKVAQDIRIARDILDNATAGLSTRPPWLITEFGANCAQGIGEPGAAQFPSALHDMIDQASCVHVVILLGPGGTDVSHVTGTQFQPSMLWRALENLKP